VIGFCAVTQGGAAQWGLYTVADEGASNMRRRGLTAMSVTGMLLVAAGLLTACTGAGEPAPTAVGDLEVEAAWVDGGRMIAVTTWGSSTCVPVAEEAVVGDDGALAVTLTDAGPQGTEQACTTDMVQRATLVGVPEGVDPAAGLEVEVTYANAVGDAALAAVTGLAGPGTETDYAPSAGWVGTDGTFALVTWGSSSCAPELQDLQVPSETEVAITFATPAADRVCTMDMAPRVLLAVAEGLGGATGVDVVLQGDTFAGTRVPILG